MEPQSCDPGSLESTVRGVRVTPSPSHPAAIDPARLLADCDLTRTRRSGPGGQHRNKVETAVVIRHRPSGIEASASEERSQEKNRRQAVRRLRIKLALELRSASDAAGEPSPLWRGRCRDGRLHVNPEHDDFPALLAEALDAIARCDGDVAAAAPGLGVTASQLVKLLGKEPAALTKINRDRAARGLAPLR